MFIYKFGKKKGELRDPIKLFNTYMPPKTTSLEPAVFKVNVWNLTCDVKASHSIKESVIKIILTVHHF